MRTYKKLVMFALVFSFSATFMSAFIQLTPEASAQAKSGYQITTSLPGTSLKAGDYVKGNISIAGYVAEIYRGALLLVGIIALAAIVFWGVKYAISGGNASKTADASDGITQALLGLVLLLSAYILLRLINPALVELTATDTRLSGIDAIPEAIPDAVKKVYNSGGTGVPIKGTPSVLLYNVVSPSACASLGGTVFSPCTTYCLATPGLCSPTTVCCGTK